MRTRLKLIATGLFTLIGLASLTAAPAAELKVGANIGNVPWEFQDSSGKLVGFEIDLVNEIAKRLGTTANIVNIPFTGLFGAVQSGQIDAAVSSITITPKRLGSVSFAQPYYDSDQSLTVKSDSGLKSLKDLAGKIVGVDTSSTGDIYATQHQAEFKIAGIQRYEGLNGYISDIPALQYYVKDKPAYAVVERILTGEQYSIMFAKDAPLADKVDAIITKLKQEGFIAGLHEKWFGAKAEATTSTVKVMERPKL
jgi:polar amino acid transport system substrate-binding protein